MTKALIDVSVHGAGELAAAMAEPLREDAADGVENAVAEIRDQVKQRVPMRRGVLRASTKGYVHRYSLGGLVAVGGKGAKHAHLINMGVKPHELNAGRRTHGRSKKRAASGKSGNMLIYGNATIIRRGAHHGGFAGVDFMGKGLEAARPGVEDDLHRAGVEITTRYAKFERRRRKRTRR